MRLTCPACNKSDQDGANCQRCGCELSTLRAVREAAAASLARAHVFASQRQWAEARVEAEASWDLEHSEEAAQLAYLLAGALGDTANAMDWHERARAAES